jgi:hypothetical protein
MIDGDGRWISSPAGGTWGSPSSLTDVRR